jgi:Zinc carboxypeptidase
MHPIPAKARSTARLQPSRLKVPAALSAIVLLVACASSVPLPPWTPGAPAAPAAPAVPQAARPAPAPLPQAAPPVIEGVRTSPVAPPSVFFPGAASSAPAAPAAATEAAPYSAAVAARFPAPSVVYNTPGLQPGRTTFTSQAEIQNWLREQVGAVMRVPGVKAAVVSAGSTQRGEALEALVLTRGTGTDPATLQASGKPTVLLIGQQHGDEPAGSEALLVIARELSQGLLQPLLERINVIIVPRANPDGAAAGQRVTIGGLDMNRDHLLLETPEAQALARLERDYHPTVVIDAHEYTVVGRYLQKFGTVQKFDALTQYATTANLPEFLTKAAEEWYRRPMLTALKNQGLTSEWYYTTSTDLADRKISMGGTQPDTGRNVNGLKNNISLLIETRGVGIGRLHIQRRVHTHVTAITSVLASTAQRAAELTQLRPYLDKEVSGLACKDNSTVEAAPTAAQYDLTMLDPVTGADKVVSVDWDSALALRKLKSRIRPCGYWLSADSARAVERLRLQGVQVQRVTESGSLLGDSYRETSRTSGERQDVRGTIAAQQDVVKVQVALMRGVVDVPRGSYYVPMAQPLGNLVMAALEPDTQSSFFANHLINGLQDTARALSEPALKLEELP